MASCWVVALWPLLAAAAASIDPPSPLPPRYLRTLAHDPRGYDPTRAGAVTDLLLGDLLFHSPRTLGPVARRLGLSCQSCHPNGATNRTFAIPGISDRPGNVDLTTGHFRTGAEDHVASFTNIPSLRGARFTGPYGRDGRTASLGEFTAGVVTAEFAGPSLPPDRLAALVTYVQNLDFLPNPNLATRGRLMARVSAEARRGETVFKAPRVAFDGGSCATCHEPTSFFRDGRVHRLGSGAPPSPHALDDGFETPTLLGLGETAPYFHDGRFATLGEVVAWFDTTYALGLSARDRTDLVAYLEAVGASDRRGDDRPRARVMIDTFVYIGLLLEGTVRDDREIWAAAVELVEVELGRHPVIPALADRVGAVRARLNRLRDAAASGAALAPLRSEVEALRRDLFRLAADWAGALGLPGTP